MDVLQEASQSHIELHDDDANAVEGVLCYLYGLNAMTPCSSLDLASRLVYVIALYAVADKYDVPALKREILASFRQVAEKEWLTLWTTGHLVEILEAIYNCTTSLATDEIRVLVVGLTFAKMTIFRDKSNVARFRDLLDAVPDFATDLVMFDPQEHSTWATAGDATSATFT